MNIRNQKNIIHHRNGDTKSTVGCCTGDYTFSHDDKPLASLLFGAPAWSCHDRDAFIGWGKDEKKRNLSMITNNTRYVIYPFVNVPHMASHILSLVRISADWHKKYGHQISNIVKAGNIEGPQTLL